MSKKRRGRKPHRGGGRVTPRGGPSGTARPRHFGGPQAPVVEDHPLAYIGEMLRDDHPMDLLTIGSSMAWLLDPKQTTPEARKEHVEPHELLDSLLHHDDPSTTALLGTFALLLDDGLARRRCANAVAQRRWSTPAWFRQLGDANVERVVESADRLGDGENVYLELHWPTGQVLTIVAYIDHNFGSVVKNAFTMPITVDEMRVALEDHVEAEDMVFVDIDPAAARARVEQAVEWSNRTWPPLETDSWPASQPLLRWALGLLPEGGVAPEPKEWSEAELASIERSFLNSAHAADLAPGDEALVEPVIWYGTGYGHGDPYRWGAPRVEILLLDWFPRKVVAPFEELARLPDVLRAFIRWAHDEGGIPERLTEETLRVVDEYEDDYLAAVADEDRLQGPAALLAAMGVPPQDDGELDWSDVWEARMVELHVQAVGGEAAYEELDAEPLPDESLSLDRLPEDIRDRVGRIAALVDEVCDDFFGDVELRTACRRFLTDAAAGDPAVFRRRSKDEPLAGAVCWVVAKANHALGHGDSGAMLSVLGIKGSVSQRAEPLLRAVGADDWSASYEPHLGTPRYLTSARRRPIVARRDGRRSG